MEEKKVFLISTKLINIQQTFYRYLSRVVDTHKQAPDERNKPQFSASTAEFFLILDRIMAKWAYLH